MRHWLMIVFSMLFFCGCELFSPDGLQEVHLEELGAEELKQQLRVGVKLRVAVSAAGVPVVQEQVLEVSGVGDVVLPYVQSIQCEGMTIEEFREELTKRYAKYYRDPVVTAYYVPLAEGGSSPYGQVLVMGCVGRPGIVPIPPTCDLTLMQAIQIAGGMGQWADPTAVRLTREVNGVKQSVVLDTERIGRRGASELNVRLMPKDIINVPESNW